MQPAQQHKAHLSLPRKGQPALPLVGHDSCAVVICDGPPQEVKLRQAKPVLLLMYFKSLIQLC